MTKQRTLRYILVVSTLVVALTASGAGFAPTSAPAPAKVWAGDGLSIDPGDEFFVPRPNPGALQQIADLRAQGNMQDAALVKDMIRIPQAVWFTQGDPASVERDVRSVVRRAYRKGSVPVLVAYNIPFRDCAQFSAGGATTVEEYEAWIDGFAAGIGDLEAVVILEPDGLGIIPFYDPYGSADGSNQLEWCQPPEAAPDTAAADRFLMLNYAVDAFKALADTSVYLDGTHSDWLGSGDAADRLVQAGVERADGFFLNVSNYQFTTNSIQSGTWISDCIAYATSVNPGDFFGCPNQYWNGGPEGTKIADLLGPWTGVELNSYGEWSDTTDDPALNTSGINWRYGDMLGATQPTTHFVIDTSRNGVGPWQPPEGVYPDPQDWCNPPDRGLGLRPTSDTGQALVDAYLWVKIPGESDGECTRGLGPAGSTVDPEWGIIDPAAGSWFPEMTLDLVHNANPLLEP